MRPHAGALWHGVLSGDLYAYAMDVLDALDALEVRGSNMDWLDALDDSFLRKTWFFWFLAWWWALCLNSVSLDTQFRHLTMHSSQCETNKFNGGRHCVLQAAITQLHSGNTFSQTGCASKY